ncbi:MAG: hypothetical protein V4622_01525 [Bacteroidota bacterium]
MKTIYTILVFYFISLTSIDYSQKINSTGEKKANPKWDLYLNTCKTYCTDAYYILSNVSRSEYWASFGPNSTNDTSRIIYNLETVVHEATHGFNLDIARKQGLLQGYFVNPQKMIAVEKTEVYNSHKLDKVIPDSLQKKIQRYNTYVGKREYNLASQTDGIYGLLDEFSAYYQGSLVLFNLKPWYEATYGYSSPNPWTEKYLPQIGGNVAAFYEFRILMAWYLEYSKAKYPEQYKKIMANTGLREAFTLLYDQFEKLANDYESEVTQTALILNEKGFKVLVDKKYITIYLKNSSTGQGHYLDEFSKLNTIFTPQLAAVLKEFRI